MFKQRKNKRFNYKPRFQDSTENESRDDDFETKWSEARQTTKKSGNVLSSLPALIIMLVSIFILIYILEGYTK